MREDRGCVRTEIQLDHLRMSALNTSIVLCLCSSSRSCTSCERNCSQLEVLGGNFKDANNDTKVKSPC